MTDIHIAQAKPVTAISDGVSRTPTFIRLLRNPLGVVGLVVVTLVLAAAVFAPWLAPMDPNYANINGTLAPPNSVNLLGTDSGGRDVLSRLIYGAQIAVLTAVLCSVVSVAIGLPTGLIAGYYGKFFDTVSDWVASILMALPAIVILLTVRAALGPSVWISAIVFGVIISPGYFRLTRTAVQAVRNELYVDAARVSGLSDARIISRHILSVVRAPIIIQTAAVCSVAIAIGSGLDFLGLGDPKVPTWGSMLADGFRNIYFATNLLIWPALVLGATMGSLVLLGNALRDAFDDIEKAVPAGRGRTHPAAVQSTTALRVVAKPTDDEENTQSGPNRLLTVTGLAVGYPRRDGSVKKVVENVSFFIDRGDVVGIVGESGSGKSQAAFSILGLLPEQARIVGGSIEFDGTSTVTAGSDVVDQAAVGRLRGRRISYIPQEPMSNLDPSFTIGAQLVRPMVKLLRISRREAKRRALELLGSVGIPDPARIFRAYPHEISGGMAQRVLIAGAISCEPDLIVADEPTTALDVTLQAEVLDMLRGLRQRLGVAVMLVTHNFGVVADICDRVVVMQAGRVVESGTVEEILYDPQHPYTQALLGSMLQGKQPMTMLTSEAGRPETSMIGAGSTGSTGGVDATRDDLIGNLPDAQEIEERI